MKKLFLLLFLSIVIIMPINVHALSVDKNNLTIEKGDSQPIGLYANVSDEVNEIDFTLVYSTYDIPAYFSIEPGLTDTNPNGINHKIVFSEPVTGNIKLGTIRINVVYNPKDYVGTINIHSGKAITTSGETIQLKAQTINANVNVKEEDNTQTTTDNTTDTKEEKTRLLEKIESNIVKIELKDDIYEYTVNIKEDIDELDLKPIAKDDKYKIDITSQKIKELKDNKIIITVKDEDNTEEYKIKVNVLEVNKVEIDEDEFKSTYKYKGKWITLIVLLSVVLVVGVILNKKK